MAAGATVGEVPLHGRVVFEIGRFNDYEHDVGEQRKQGPRKGNR